MLKHLALLLTVILSFTLAENNNVVAVNLLGIDGGTPNILYDFVASNPALVKSQNTIQGLQNGESLLAIARYPNSTDFYGVSTANRVYHVNSTTAQANYISSLSCDVRHSNPTLSIAFSPFDGSLEIVTLIAESTSNHFTANLHTGACQTLPILSYPSASRLAFPSPAGVAFYNNLPYVVDANSNSVLSTYTGSTLNQVGPLNNRFSGVGGFAIAADSGRYFGLAALYTPSSSALWAINLQNGNSFQAATLGALTTNLIGFGVLADAQGVNYPFPYLGIQYDPNAQYTQATGSNTAQDALFGTSTNGNSDTNANSNTNGNTNTNNNGNSNTNGETNGNSNTNINGNTNGNSDSNSNGNTNTNNGNIGATGGSQVITGSTFTATIGTPSMGSSASTFTTQVTTQGTQGTTASNIATIFPVGNNGRTADITYTETINAYDYRGGEETKTAIVVIPSGTQIPRAGFTGTVLVGQGTNTVVEEAGIAIPAGASATVAINQGSSTIEGVILLNGAQAVTVGQLSDVTAGQTSATAVVTIADDQGRTSQGIASFVLPSQGTAGAQIPTAVGRDQNSASSLIISLSLSVITILLL